MKNMVIIKTGDSIPPLVSRRGDFEDWIITGMGNGRAFSGQVIAVHRGETPPAPDLFSGIVVTGSHAMVTDGSDWIIRTAEWLLEAVRKEVPVLGICFGHQILAHALGGKVGKMPGLPEFGTVPLTLTADAANDPVFGSLPRAVGVQTSHYQSVLKLPPMSVLLASTEKDPHSAFRYGRCAWGVQFHPEYDADIADAYINEFNRETREIRKDAALLPLNSSDTAAGRMILGRFAAVVAGRSGKAPQPASVTPF